MQNDLKVLGDVGFGAVAAGSVLGWLPAVAAVVSIVWFSIQIWESKTGQYWRAKAGSLFRRGKDS